MKIKNYELTIHVNNKQKPIQEYVARDQTYVEGREGSSFNIRFHNHSSSRVLVIPAVDGLSVLDGKPAGPHSGGYIVEAKSSITIPGWTLDNNQAAQFEFATKSKSYATNHPENPSSANVGVIGVLVYSEKVKPLSDYFKDVTKTPWPDYPYKPPITWSMQDASFEPSGMMSLNSKWAGSVATGSITRTSMQSSASLSSQESSFDLGTGFGKSTEFKTTTASFERNAIEATFALYYDTRKNLEKLGIEFGRKLRETRKPQAFPLIGCVPPVGYSQ